VLGGGSDSRLFMILREQKSWTYGSYAALRRSRGLGYWQATFEGRTEVTDSALTELLHQIDRVRTETIPDSELVAAKGFLVGSFPLTIETPAQIAQVVTTARLLGLGPDYIQRYRERLTAVSGARARAAAQRVFKRDALTIVVVGDAKALYDKLQTIAPVRLADIEGNAMDPAELNPTGGPVAFDRSQVVARSDSFQALVQGNVLGGQTAKVVTDGDSIVYTESTVIGSFVQQQSEDDRGRYDGTRRYDRRQRARRPVARPAARARQDVQPERVFVRRGRDQSRQREGHRDRERGGSGGDIPGLPARAVRDAVAGRVARNAASAPAGCAYRADGNAVGV